MSPISYIAPFWEDLSGFPTPPGREIRYRHLVGGGRTVDTTIIEWHNWGYSAGFGDPFVLINFQVILESTGDITFNYLNVDATIMFGPQFATVGIENADASIGIKML